MMTNLPDEFNNVDIEVIINGVVEGPLASKLKGLFIINGGKYNFNAIAFGRIGGHNVSIKVSNTSLTKIKKMNLDPEVILLIVQRKIIEGDFKIQNTPKNIH